ncbi:MAG: class I adenylate-forming enzyme family protein [Burkholderiales bacterium]
MSLPGLPIARRFDAVAASAGRRLAVREEGRAWSYDHLLERSIEISERLATVCRQPGRRVGLMAPNSGAFVAAFFAIARLGGVVVPLNVRYRSQELRYYVEDSRAVALLATPNVAAIAREALESLARTPALVEIDFDGSCRVLQPGTVGAAPAGDAPLLCQYTSGSTGPPKRVVRTHANLDFELQGLTQALALHAADRFLGATPFTHVNGLVRTMMTSMTTGATLYPVQEFRRRYILELIRRERITFFAGVPTMFALLADTAPRGEVDLSSLRMLISASAPLLPEDSRRFLERYAVPVRQLYGSTETGTISVNLHPHPESCLESVGTPLQGVRIEILDDAGRPLPDGEGEVAIASPGAFRSYEGNAQANASRFSGEFYLSGDLGRRDRAGYLTLTGRKKFLINRGGYKVNPVEVEEALRSHPKVEAVAVVGAPGPHGDEIVRCVVVPRTACTAEELIEHCRPRIADFKIPSRFEFRDSLPKTDTGKLLRREL